MFLRLHHFVVCLIYKNKNKAATTTQSLLKMLTFNTIEDVALEEIVKIFVQSFVNYYVVMPTETKFWKKRWKTNRVRYDLSIGTFDDEGNLIGFMIIGVDYRNGKKVAFNAGTGVVPEFRGQKLVKRMYQYAIPLFKKNGIEEMALEVINKNIKAIKAYQSVGFKIEKLYQCFRSTDMILPTFIAYHSKKVKHPNWKKYEQFTVENYCWEYLIEGIEINIKKVKCFEIYSQSDELMAYYIINPKSKSILRFEAKNENGYHALFNHWYTNFGQITILNVQHPEKIKFLENYKFNNNIDQFEMIRLV